MDIKSLKEALAEYEAIKKEMIDNKDPQKKKFLADQVQGFGMALSSQIKYNLDGLIKIIEALDGPNDSV